jgi:hypothetical protein
MSAYRTLVAVRASSVRARIDLGSQQLGILREGETVIELERRELGGMVRVRCERGWVSLASGDGTVLLRTTARDAAAAPATAAAEPARSHTSANDLHRALLSLQGARSASRGPSTQPRFDAESMVADLIEEARSGRSRPPPPLTPPPTMSSASVQSPDALHARVLVEQHAMQTARDAFAAVRVAHRTLPQHADSPMSAYTHTASTPCADPIECHDAGLSETVHAAVEQERAAMEEAFRNQLMAVRADAATQLAQAQASAQDAAKEAQSRHEAEMATAIQQTAHRVQQETDQVYRLRIEEAELRAKTEHDAELQRARTAAAEDTEAARRQAAAHAEEACRAHYRAEMSEAVHAAVEQERAAAETARLELKAEADENLRAQLQAADMKARQQVKDALALASSETEASIEAAMQAATIRTKQAEEQQHALQIEELQRELDAQRENAVVTAVRESVAQSEAQLEQERTKSRHTRELAADQARLEATQAERQVAATRLAEAQKEISHHRLQAETLRVKLAQTEASSAARQEDAVRNAQEMARRELDTAIANATHEHQAQIQRASQQTQQARTELTREVERVRETEKARYDSQISELERSIDGRMQALHAKARAHIEAEVAESLEHTWAELEHAGTMLGKAQRVANTSTGADGRRWSTEMAIHAARQVHETQHHDVTRSKSRQSAVASHSHSVSVEQDPAYIRVRTRNLEAARSRARAQSAGHPS